MLLNMFDYINLNSLLKTAYKFDSVKKISELFFKVY